MDLTIKQIFKQVLAKKTEIDLTRRIHAHEVLKSETFDQMDAKKLMQVSTELSAYSKDLKRINLDDPEYEVLGASGKSQFMEHLLVSSQKLDNKILQVTQMLVLRDLDTTIQSHDHLQKQTFSTFTRPEAESTQRFLITCDQTLQDISLLDTRYTCLGDATIALMSEKLLRSQFSLGGKIAAMAQHLTDLHIEEIRTMPFNRLEKALEDFPKLARDLAELHVPTGLISQIQDAMITRFVREFQEQMMHFSRDQLQEHVQKLPSLEATFRRYGLSENRIKDLSEGLKNLAHVSLFMHDPTGAASWYDAMSPDCHRDLHSLYENKIFSRTDSTSLAYMSRIRHYYNAVLRGDPSQDTELREHVEERLHALASGNYQVAVEFQEHLAVTEVDRISDSSHFDAITLQIGKLGKRLGQASIRKITILHELRQAKREFMRSLELGGHSDLKSLHKTALFDDKTLKALMSHPDMDKAIKTKLNLLLAHIIALQHNVPQLWIRRA